MTKQVSTPPAGNSWVAVEEFFASKTGLFLGGAVLGLHDIAQAMRMSEQIERMQDQTRQQTRSRSDLNLTL